MNKIAVVDSGIDEDLYPDKVTQHFDFVGKNDGEKNKHEISKKL